MSISEQFKGLPMEDLIGAPLIAAANAQGKLANLTKNFIQEVGADENGKIRNVNFTYGKTYKKSPKSDDIEEVDKTLTVPLLAIVNIPSLSVKKVNVDFEICFTGNVPLLVGIVGSVLFPNQAIQSCFLPCPFKSSSNVN